MCCVLVYGEGWRQKRVSARQGGASAGPLEITDLKIHQHWIAVGTQHGHIFVFDHFQVSEKGGLGYSFGILLGSDIIDSSQDHRYLYQLSV